MRPSGKLDGRLRRRKLARIVEQVHQYLLHEQPINGHGWQIVGQVGFDGVIAELPIQPVEHDSDDLFNRLQLAVHLDGAGFKPGQIKQVDHQSVQAVGFVEN